MCTYLFKYSSCLLLRSIILPAAEIQFMFKRLTDKAFFLVTILQKAFKEKQKKNATQKCHHSETVYRKGKMTLILIILFLRFETLKRITNEVENPV